jgi:hypothetical protein
MTDVLSRGRTIEQADELTRVFHGLEVVDATSDLRVTVTGPDVDSGVPGDFEECALAQACRREFHSEEVCVMRTTSYIAIRGEDGIVRLERFKQSPAAYEFIADHDRGRPLPKDGRAFVFRAPRPSEGLERQRLADKKRRAARKGKASPSGRKLPGTITPTTARSMTLVRSGQGQWQMNIVKGGE